MTQPRFTVSGGKFTSTVPARSAVAIHTGALGAPGSSSSVAVTFQQTATTTYGEVNVELSGLNS